MRFETKGLSESADAVAPDGSEVRLLARSERGSMAEFRLPPGAVSRAVAHRSVEELWFVVAGTGRMWRRLGEAEEIVSLSTGVSLSLPVGTSFQFRCDGTQPLVAVGVTMPPWPGAEEAVFVAGVWEPAAS
ncbi:MAG TPA: cupin domain-containing protein [Stellaceae bacterium]|nr:cupin domain-containing protein [Stellaceae bacterium]